MKDSVHETERRLCLLINSGYETRSQDMERMAKNSLANQPNLLFSNGIFDPSFQPDKLGHRCIGSTDDGTWDVYVDHKSSNTCTVRTYHEIYQHNLDSIAESPHPDSSECFLWNHLLQIKVQLPPLLFKPDLLLKCLVSCFTARKGKKQQCVYEVYIFNVLSSSYIWCSNNSPKWQGAYIFDPDCWSYSDFVLFESDNLCGITQGGLLCRGSMQIQTPNCSLVYTRHLVIVHGKERDRLLVVERRIYPGWEVWEIDFAGQRWVKVSNLDGIVVSINSFRSVSYSRPGLKGNCICFNENVKYFYVFSLADQTVSVFKNQPHSGFPGWFPNLGNPGMPWLSFVEEEDEAKNKITEEPNEQGNESTTFCSDEVCDLANRFLELPSDLQRAVFQAFSALDYTNFRLVCKDWKRIAPSIQWKPNISGSCLEFSWLMLCNEEQQCISVTDPTCNMRFYYNYEELLRSEIRYSKDGWLLVTKGARTIFFLEPFSKTKITLPNLPEDYQIDAIMPFSSSPESSDWIIISVLSLELINRVTYLRSGDKQWNTIDYPVENYHLFYSCESPVFHGSKFYYMDIFGNLCTFWWDLEAENFQSRTITIGGFTEQFSNFSRGYLISCEDDLYVIAVKCFGESASTYKLDFESLEWKRTEMLKNYSFFISKTSSFAVRVTETTQQGTIYFPLFIGNRFLFYKSDASEFRCLDDDYSSRRGIYERKELPNGIWIQPKVISSV